MSDAALSEEHLSQLLEKVYTARGWDFRHYRRSSIKRCIERRMAIAIRKTHFQEDSCKGNTK
ncbi:MAG: hypothetical protein IT392_08040 [Nitrospirae bacterium]|nr:hypothetical protein [Nitrospirota bacterium]